MEQTVFSEKMAGLTIDEVIRDYEFTMQTKHFHDSFELYFLLEGERYYFIDRETYHVKKEWWFWSTVSRFIRPVWLGNRITTGSFCRSVRKASAHCWSRRGWFR